MAIPLRVSMVIPLRVSVYGDTTEGQCLWIVEEQRRTAPFVRATDISI